VRGITKKDAIDTTPSRVNLKAKSAVTSLVWKIKGMIELSLC